MTGPLRVHHLNCGHLRGLSIGGQPLACHVLLIETPTDGLVLVDTGLGTADYADISSRLGFPFARAFARPAIDPRLAAIRQVEQLGFQPTDVRHIVQTHLDLDHVGGLSDFPWARVHVHETELAAARARRGLRAQARYRPQMWAHGPHFETYDAQGDPWFGLPAVRSLRGLPEEILLVPLPGHTIGHCGVAVETETGWLLDAGDAYFDPREVHQPVRQVDWRVRLFERAVTTDRAARDEHQAKLRALLAGPAQLTVFCSHDPAGFPGGTTAADRVVEGLPAGA